MSVREDSGERTLGEAETDLVQNETADPGDEGVSQIQGLPASDIDENINHDVRVSRDSLEERPRAWRSAPPSPANERRGISTSLLSLHTEEFLELLSTAQTRRLEEQRAEFPPPAPRKSRHRSVPSLRHFSLPSDEKGLVLELQRRRGGSWVGRSQRKKPPTIKIPAQEELYSTIIGHQAQRMEDQRCSPPIPQAAADLFEILFRVQGNRLDEQRVDLPSALGGAC
ncbi:G-protein-signaling modulator 3 [Bombina bombina]|uniref:G-protein-signaling modulator 3 n=1 Tax=Bombina bombina TaxID=8345 RepID=UPI00235A786A|nr:G-protein-signaling modulator 3 [Bombina bombina]XP_053577984.1 G-protein-signaling modulator 3 [Bombina bombina]XP_053577985.1 G-protein-signaling modulator 3 [Bombina bombina]XP_053577986.1 G-protein-signaling modulator 3 [Bombina bombina]XP_053577987.1 G-protein-signaling modulator 3 [Bombina bombina]XP_053577988.1 G-protein-signaling modulator 3 [Bombina bombina]